MIIEIEIHSKPQTVMNQLLGNYVLSKKLKNISSANNSSYNPIIGA